MCNLSFCCEKFVKCLSEWINSVRAFTFVLLSRKKKLISRVLFMLRWPFEVRLKAWKMHFTVLLLFLCAMHFLCMKNFRSPCPEINELKSPVRNSLVSIGEKKNYNSSSIEARKTIRSSLESSLELPLDGVIYSDVWCIFWLWKIFEVFLRMH